LAGSEMPRLVVDVVIPSGRGVVLIRRASDPFEGRWPLPGGFVEIGETVESSAAHEAAEKTGLAVELARQGADGVVAATTIYPLRPGVPSNTLSEPAAPGPSGPQGPKGPPASKLPAFSKARTKASSASAASRTTR
jgi:8-oxo-dGTP pyrophosphatase MutT (NUDIX family)